MKNKLTVRKLLKNTVKSFGECGHVEIECAEFSIWFFIHIIEKDEICVLISNGCVELVEKILEMEVSEYKIKNSPCLSIEIKIKNDMLEKKYIL